MFESIFAWKFLVFFFVTLAVGIVSPFLDDDEEPEVTPGQPFKLPDSRDGDP